MIPRLLVVVFLLLVGRVAATATCTIDTNYGALTLPDQVEPAVTSFCHRALETPPSKANDHPPLLLSLTASREVSSFCSCVLDHIQTSAPKNPSTPLPTKTYTKTLTVSVTKSHCITTATTRSVTVSKTASTATVTVTKSHCITTATTKSVTVSKTVSTETVTVTNRSSAFTVTVSAPTITVSAPTVTVSPSTVTISASTVTVSASTVTVSASTVTVSAPTVTISASTTITLSASITTITITVTPTIPTTTAASPTSSTSTRSTAPTGPPTCTPAANPSGTCAYAADYNSGLTPQLWAGAAASLDACAFLCAGEPGCLSLAYNPSAALQCVLFNAVTSRLTTTSDAGSSTIFYDSTCFACSGVPPRPPTDDGCTPALQPPANSACDFNAIDAGAGIFAISAPGNTASSLGACTQQCLALPACQSLSFDGTNCHLYSTTVIDLEIDGLIFPVNPGVAGSITFYDRGCSVCPTLACVCPPPAGKRDLARRQIGVERREASVERREAELERRIVVVEERERSVMGHG